MNDMCNIWLVNLIRMTYLIMCQIKYLVKMVKNDIFGQNF
jgi:hypothetical protein